MEDGIADAMLDRKVNDVSDGNASSFVHSTRGREAI